MLANALDVPIVMGEFLPSIYDYVPYILRGALDEVRFIVDNVGGITGGMKLARMAECFNMMCQPHNWGTFLDHVVHFHCELAMPNNIWFEMDAAHGHRGPPLFQGQDPPRQGWLRSRAGEARPGLRAGSRVLDNMMLRVES